MSHGLGQGRVDAVAAQDAFRIRMQNQCKQIERYRLAMLRDEDRRLSRDEAALEWIERYAELFSRLEAAVRRAPKGGS